MGSTLGDGEAWRPRERGGSLGVLGEYMLIAQSVGRLVWELFPSA